MPPELFRRYLARPKWRLAVKPILLSGVTDCYQPCEKQFQLTRKCLEVALDARQPMRITTKNALVVRDVDVLAEMAKHNLIYVTMSLASFDQSLTRMMEPRSSSPQSRLNAIGELSAAGVPVKVLTAPIIPAINEQEIPRLLELVSKAGARYADYIMLRLPLSVEPVFFEWLSRNFPDREEKIKARLESLGDGKLYDSGFGVRMKGQGIWAEQIKTLFETYCLKFGLERNKPELDCSLFRSVAGDGNRQLNLF